MTRVTAPDRRSVYSSYTKTGKIAGECEQMSPQGGQVSIKPYATTWRSLSVAAAITVVAAVAGIYLTF